MKFIILLLALPCLATGLQSVDLWQSPFPVPPRPLNSPPGTDIAAPLHGSHMDHTPDTGTAHRSDQQGDEHNKVQIGKWSRKKMAHIPDEDKEEEGDVATPTSDPSVDEPDVSEEDVAIPTSEPPGDEIGVSTQDAKRERVIAMQLSIGCSGSTFVQSTLKRLLEAHGYYVWSPVKEFIQNDKAFHKILKKKKHTPKGIYCTEADGTEHVWAADATGRLEGVWSVLNGSLACAEASVQDMMKSDVVFLFDGHSVEHMTEVMPFFSRLGPHHGKIYGSRRSNALERLICHVKDCRYMKQEYPSYPVLGANGSKEASSCFSRREAAPEDQPKVYLDPRNLLELVKAEGLAPWEQEPLRTALADGGFTSFAQFSYEELCAYEYSKEADKLEGSVELFLGMLEAVGVKTPKREIVKDLLVKDQGMRSRLPVEDEIYNLQDVSDMLGSALETTAPSSGW